MMKKYRSLLLLVLYIVLPNLYFSQKSDKIWIDGLGRSFFSSDAQINEEDTISASNISSGYNLIDLNTHINPFETIEIFGQVRIISSSFCVKFHALPIGSLWEIICKKYENVRKV